jgi:hypothetical protein
VELELNQTCHLLVCVDDLNSLGENVNNMGTKALLDASKEVGLEVNTEKPEYIFMSYYQAIRQG